MSERTKTMGFLVLVLVACAAMSRCGVAQAQDGPEDVEHLELGERAPWGGWLLQEPLLVAMRAEVVQLRYRLEHDVQLAHDTAAVRVSVLEERLRIRDDLWARREQELQVQVAEARASAIRQWYEAEGLWFALGVVVTVVVGVVAAVAIAQ